MSLIRTPGRRRPHSGRAFLLTAVTVASILTASGCSISDTSEASGSGGGYVTGPRGVTTVAKANRVVAPKLDGETIDGKALDISTLKGKVVVLNIWGSWCGPCRLEAPYFAKVSKELEASGQPVAFVGINTRDNTKQAASAFEQTNGITYPSLYDPDGKLMLRFPKGTLNPQAIPSTIVLDKDGKIAARTLAAIKDDTLHEMIDPLLAEQ
ncbi:TlpA family protein disulfide reductase [Streptomyces sp. NPDC058892]|uniref:TlpA family protein disulfide reductase n=1 Tax=unclassified Streptomyces TaxID=2593676 RepID=UPI003698CE1C